MEIVNLCCTSLLYDFQDIEQGFLHGGDIVNLFCSSLLVNLSHPTHLNVSKTFPPHPKRTKQGRTFGALLGRENGSRSSTLAVRTPCFLTGRKQNIPEYSRYAPTVWNIYLPGPSNGCQMDRSWGATFRQHQNGFKHHHNTWRVLESNHSCR